MINSNRNKGNLYSALLITTGTIIGQGSLLVAIPFLTRLFTPDQLGLYAMFVAVAGVFATTSALHYELVIPLPKSDLHARLITKIAIVIVVLISFIMFGVILIYEKKILVLLNAPELEGYLLWVSFSLIMAGLISILSARVVRKNNYRATAIGNAARGVIQTVLQIGSGMLGFGVIGLIVGGVIGQVAMVLSLSNREFWSEIRNGWFIYQSKYRGLLNRYKKFPLISTPSSIANSLGAHMPVFMLAIYFDAAIVGYFAISFRVLQIPMRFLGQALSPVYFGLAAQAKRDGELGIVTASVWRPLFIFSLYSFVLIGFITPDLFSIAFGGQWRTAGVYTQYLVPWIMGLFICTVLGSLVSVLEKQLQELAFQIGYLVVVLVSLWLCVVEHDSYLAMKLLGIGGVILFFGKMVWLLHIAEVDLKESFKSVFLDLVIVSILSTIIILIGTLNINNLISISISVLIVISAHLVNYYVRKIYAF